MEASIVIKVKYGNILRRFSADLNENEKLELNMVALKAKICTLFNLAPDADMVLTYIDVDGDVVALVDDEDLDDVMRQGLNPFRISVILNNDKSSCRSSRSSGSSTPVRLPNGVQTPLPDGFAEVLRSLPHPLRDVIAQMSLDLASRAVKSAPLVADIIDSFSKNGQSSQNPLLQSQGGDELSGQRGTSETKDSVRKDDPLPDLNISADSLLGKKNEVEKGSNSQANKNEAEKGSNSHANKKNEGEKGGNSQGSEKSAHIFKGHNHFLNRKALSSNFSRTPIVGCPFSGTSLTDESALPSVLSPSYVRNHSLGDRMGLVFHTGVQCDGCGVHPITGPRFKSKVKEDYDLCSICFSEMGNEADYVRIDRPMSYLIGFHDHMQRSRLRPPVQPGLFKTLLKHGRPKSKLDSHFILDVNVVDGTTMAPLTPFTKIWRMCNNGGQVWPRGTQLVWIGGDSFSDVMSVDVETSADGVPMGKEVDIAVDFVAPERPGRFISYWRMAAPSGQKFGQRVWVLIQVDASIKNSVVSDNLLGLNLNLPPESDGSKWPVVTELNVVPHVDRDLPNPCNSDAISVPAEAVAVDTQLKQGEDQNFPSSAALPLVGEMPIYDQENTFPINDSLLVGDGAPKSASAPPVAPSVTYPIVDADFVGVEAMAQSPIKSSPSVDVPASSAQAADNNNVEQALLKELEEMGFNQVDLNKEILRMNEYNLEQSLDDLCGVSEWDPILEELEEMGFCDKEVNKKLLVKNNGSIKGVVMDLIAGEKAL